MLRLALYVAVAFGLSVLSAVAYAGLLSGPDVPGNYVEDASLVTPDGLRRYFNYYQPNTLKDQPTLILVFHGGRGNPDRIVESRSAQSEWLQIADEEGLLVIYPAGTNRRTRRTRGNSLTWNDCRPPETNPVEVDDVAFALTLMDWAAQQFNVDPARVFATGASNGGMMSLRLATEAPSSVAAIATFIANHPQPNECGPPTAAIPALLMQGTEDPLVPYEGGCADSVGCVASAAQTIELWLQANGVEQTTPQVLTYADLDSGDGSTIIRSAYASPPRVVALRGEGAGHQMPSIEHSRGRYASLLVGPQNRDLESAREAWTFFQAHMP